MAFERIQKKKSLKVCMQDKVIILEKEGVHVIVIENIIAPKINPTGNGSLKPPRECDSRLFNRNTLYK